MAQTRGFRAGTRSGAAAARAWKRAQGTSGSSQDRSGARGSGSGVGGTITPTDYAIKHSEGFGTSQPESLTEGLKNIYGGQAGVIRDKDTGALLVIDSDTNEVFLIEPTGGLTEAQRKKIIDSVDKQGDVPNISTTVKEGDSYLDEGDYSYSSQSYTEGDVVGAPSGPGGSGSGGLSKIMLLVAGVALVALYMLFGGWKK